MLMRHHQKWGKREQNSEKSNEYTHLCTINKSFTDYCKIHKQMGSRTGLNDLDVEVEYAKNNHFNNSIDHASHFHS